MIAGMNEKSTYTVKQLARLAGVSVRTLHYYDEIGLLKPSSVRENGYRQYGEDALLRLQQILFFREMGLNLALIGQILDTPGFDLARALQTHRKALQGEIERMQTLIHTIDSTMMRISGEVNMNDKKLFEGFSPEKEKQYSEEAVNLWGDTARQSINLWKSYSEEKKQQIMQESNAIYTEIIANMSRGVDSAPVQAALADWHQHMRSFYEPTPEMLRGLGEMYCDNPDFNATFTAMHPDLPAFLKQAIAIYVERLESK